MQPVIKRTFRDQIVSELRAAVLSGQLPPGSQIAEATLATRFGVSRGPLREALRHLIEEGLFVTVPYTGTHVIDLSLDDVREIFSLRVELEIFAFKLVWPTKNAAFSDEISRRHMRLLERIEAGDGDGSIAAELALHSFPYEASGHRMLLSVWDGLKVKLQLYWAAYYRAHGRKGPVPTAHERYVELACGKDFDALADEVRAHMLQGFSTIEEFLSYQQRVVLTTAQS